MLINPFPPRLNRYDLDTIYKDHEQEKNLKKHKATCLKNKIKRKRKHCKK
jgi:hypothetical protein